MHTRLACCTQPHVHWPDGTSNLKAYGHEHINNEASNLIWHAHTPIFYMCISTVYAANWQIPSMSVRHMCPAMCAHKTRMHRLFTTWLGCAHARRSWHPRAWTSRAFAGMYHQVCLPQGHVLPWQCIATCAALACLPFIQTTVKNAGPAQAFSWWPCTFQHSSAHNISNQEAPVIE